MVASKKKYYAVKVGRQTGVFDTWAECKKQIDGFSGAIYKSFLTRVDAETYLSNGTAKSRINVKNNDLKTLTAYVDGSYSAEMQKYSYGCVLLGETKATLAGSGNSLEVLNMRNVAGELLGAMNAIKWAYENNYQRIVIYHDYEGIARWATGDWKTNQVGTRKYKEFIQKFNRRIDIQFEKVTAHSGDKYNDEADSLAKEALLKQD